MNATASLQPLISWDDFTVRLDVVQLHAWANREIPGRVQALKRLGLKGFPDGDLLLQVGFAWKGVPGTVAVRLRNAKVMHGFFGCQLVGVEGPLGVPLPVASAASLLKRVLPGKVQYDSTDGVLLLDLREWLPAGLALAVRRIHCGSESLELVFGPGSFAPRLPRLATGTTQG